VFSVDTKAEAERAIVSFGVQRYDGSFRWTGWPHDLAFVESFEQSHRELTNVTATLQEWWDTRHA